MKKMKNRRKRKGTSCPKGDDALAQLAPPILLPEAVAADGAPREHGGAGSGPRAGNGEPDGRDGQRGAGQHKGRRPRVARRRGTDGRAGEDANDERGLLRRQLRRQARAVAAARKQGDVGRQQRHELCSVGERECQLTFFLEAPRGEKR